MMRPTRSASGGRTSPANALRTSPAARSGTPTQRKPATAPSPTAKPPTSSSRPSAAAAAPATNGRVSPIRRTGGDSPISVAPRRADLNKPATQPQNNTSTGGLRRISPFRSPNESGISTISNVPTRDALTGGRRTPTTGSNPPTPRQMSANNRSATQPTAASVRGRSPLGNNSSTNQRPVVPRLGDKGTGHKVENPARIDAELEYEKRKKRADKIAEVARQVEREYNAQQREEARVKPDMVVSGKVHGAARKDFELDPVGPHRHASPMRRLGSVGTATANGAKGGPPVKRLDANSKGQPSKKQFPERSSHLETDPAQVVYPTTGKAKPSEGTIQRDTFTKDLKVWQLKSSTPRSASEGGKSPRRALNTNINRQQDVDEKKPVTCKAHVPAYRKDCNPVNFSGSIGSRDNSPSVNGGSRPNSPSCKARRATPPSHPDLFSHPIKTKASLLPGYQSAPNGLAGRTSNHDYRRGDHNILGLKHTEKPGTKVRAETVKHQGKRCSSAEGIRTSAGTAPQGTGNPSDMSPAPANRRLSAERPPVTERGYSPSHRTSRDNMLAFDNRRSNEPRSAALVAAAAQGSAAALRLRAGSVPKTTSPSKTTTTAGAAVTPRGSKAAASPMRSTAAGVRSATPPPNGVKPTNPKRSNSPNFQTSERNPLSIAARSKSPATVEIPKYRRSVALNRSSPNFLTEVETVGGHVTPPRPASTRRKYANASTIGGTLNWANDSPDRSTVAIQ